MSPNKPKPARRDDKPTFHLIPGDATEEEILALFKQLTEREPTPEDVAELHRVPAEENDDLEQEESTG